MISNCGHDENGRYSGGKAGDQTGNEWSLVKWYDRPWNVMLRHPDKNVAEKLSLLSIEAAENNHVGYDQGQRGTYWNALKNAKYRPSGIKTDCESDCSAGVLANVKAVGFLLKDSRLKAVDQNGYTGNMKSILTKAGFTAYEEKKYLNSDKYLLPGDILLYENHHTAVNVSTGSMASREEEKEKDKFSANVKNGQRWLNENYGNLLKKTFKELLDVDGVCGPKTRAATLAVWKDVMNRKFGTTMTPSNKKFGSECKKNADKASVVLGSSGTFTFICEILLSANRLYSGDMDGRCGTVLCEAIKKYRNAKKLGIVEKCDAPVWAELFHE